MTLPSPRKRTPRPRDGVALVLVLWLLVILGAIGAAVVSGTRTSISLASNARARVVARYAAESGVEATVAEIEREISSRSGSDRSEWLNELESSYAVGDSTTLGSARFAVTVVDPGTRLDVNRAPAEKLAILFARFVDIGRANETAGAIRSYVERGENGLMLGPITRTIRSLEELRGLAGVDSAALERAAPYLTVDGDGTINTVTAPPPVLAAASGELRSEPSRLLIISRGWLGAHPLTHEIQAVYAISTNDLVLVNWREQIR